MTTYNAIRLLIEDKVFATWDDAWKTIMNAYNRNRIDGYELEELYGLAKRMVLSGGYSI